LTPSSYQNFFPNFFSKYGIGHDVMKIVEKRARRQNLRSGGSPKSDFQQNHDGLLGGSHGECACQCMDDARRTTLSGPAVSRRAPLVLANHYL